MDRLTEERIAVNNARFRDANERIREVAEEHRVDIAVPFICECPDEECVETLRLELDDYRSFRAHPRHFLNAPGHDRAAGSAVRVVSQQDGYVVVEKIGHAGEIAEKLARPPGPSEEHPPVEPSDERARRIGLNETVFREVNERVDGLAHDFGVDDEPLELLCECGDAGCVERISMSTAAYRELRSDSTTFAIVRGHDAPDLETVVSERDGFDVVRKHPGDPARLASETDRRD
jgi:hypothetical protein